MKENKEMRSYVSPAIEVNDIMVEDGFAASTYGTPSGENDPYGEGVDFDEI